MYQQVFSENLGTSSRRVISGAIQNPPLQFQGHTCWEIKYLNDEIKRGINKVLQAGIAYRYKVTDGVIKNYFNSITKGYTYQKINIQFLFFNSLFQLKSTVAQSLKWLRSGNQLQLFSGYLCYYLTGVEFREYLNAPIAWLINCRTQQWGLALVAATAILEQWLLARQIERRITEHYQIDECFISVIYVISHDTSSKEHTDIFQVKDVAYLISGSWLLMSIESFHIMASLLTREMEDTSEDRSHILKNLIELWVVQHSAELAEQSPAFISQINSNNMRFLTSASMIQSIPFFCREMLQIIWKTADELIRCVMGNFVFLFRKVFFDLNKLNGQALNVIHIVSNGCKNKLLNQLCIDACESQVWKASLEASAIGDLFGQLITLGVIANVDTARQVVSQPSPIQQQYNPGSINVFANQWLHFQALCGIKQSRGKLL